MSGNYLGGWSIFNISSQLPHCVKEHQTLSLGSSDITKATTVTNPARTSCLSMWISVRFQCWDISLSNADCVLWICTFYHCLPDLYFASVLSVLPLIILALLSDYSIFLVSLFYPLNFTCICSVGKFYSEVADKWMTFNPAWQLFSFKQIA